MRLIDADALTKEIKTDIEDVGLQERKIFYRINDAPTIDAVPVVRCKACKYRGIIDYPVCCESTDEWFCADGEPKGGDTE